MKINRTIEEALTRALGWYGNKTDVNIFETSNFIFYDGPKVYGVNWKAMGTKTAAEASQYAKSLQRAADVVFILNQMEITVDRNELGELERIEDDDRRLVIFSKVVEYIYKALESGKADRIRFELMRAEEFAIEEELA
jgi:hypothetical protein